MFCLDPDPKQIISDLGKDPDPTGSGFTTLLLGLEKFLNKFVNSFSSKGCDFYLLPSGPFQLISRRLNIFSKLHLFVEENLEEKPVAFRKFIFKIS